MCSPLPLPCHFAFPHQLLPAHPEIDAPLTPLSLTPSQSEYGAAMLKKKDEKCKKVQIDAQISHTRGA